ncbi:hypothetical protein Q6249_29100, partial [Klebsiella pneumoniae]|uniref:hypothetical protein n=1 Tax=Klebsiella pneumoniae TaxID=573 RepID=UPI0027316CAD
NLAIPGAIICGTTLLAPAFSRFITLCTIFVIFRFSYLQMNLEGVEEGIERDREEREKKKIIPALLSISLKRYSKQH